MLATSNGSAENGARHCRGSAPPLARAIPLAGRSEGDTRVLDVIKLPSAVAAVAVARALDDVAVRPRARCFHDVVAQRAAATAASSAGSSSSSRDARGAAAASPDGARGAAAADAGGLLIVTGAGRGAPFGASLVRPTVLRTLSRAEYASLDVTPDARDAARMRVGGAGLARWATAWLTAGGGDAMATVVTGRRDLLVATAAAARADAERGGEGGAGGASGVVGVGVRHRIQKIGALGAFPLLELRPPWRLEEAPGPIPVALAAGRSGTRGAPPDTPPAVENFA